MNDWGWLCQISDIAHITVGADDRGGLRVEQSLHDGREIVGRFKYMDDLAEMVNDPTFSAQIAFVPEDEGLRCVLDTACRRLRGELH